MEAVKTKMQRFIETLPAGQQEKMDLLNRKGKRERLRIRHGAGGMFSRVLSGTPTGTTPHFKLWMADLNIRRSLERTKLLTLVHHTATPSLIATTLTILRHSGRYRNVYQLTQADAQDLLRVKGIGPKRLEDLKTYLAGNKVTVNW